MNMNIEIRNKAIADLAEIGYHFAEDNVIKVGVINASRVNVVGYDSEEDMWYVDMMHGNLEEGFEFDYNAKFFDSLSEALDCYNENI